RLKLHLIRKHTRFIAERSELTRKTLLTDQPAPRWIRISLADREIKAHVHLERELDRDLKESEIDPDSQRQRDPYFEEDVDRFVRFESQTKTDYYLNIEIRLNDSEIDGAVDLTDERHSRLDHVVE